MYAETDTPRSPRNTRRNAVRRACLVAIAVLAVAIGLQAVRVAGPRGHGVVASGSSTSKGSLWRPEPPIWPALSVDEIRRWKPRAHQIDRYDSIATPEETAARFVRSALLLSRDVDVTVVARSESQALATVGRTGASPRERLRLGRYGDRGPWLVTSVEGAQPPTIPAAGSIVRVGTQISGPAPDGATRVRIALTGLTEGHGADADVTDGRWTIAVPQLRAGFRQSQAPDGSWLTVPQSYAGSIGISVESLPPRDFDFTFTTFTLAK